MFILVIPGVFIGSYYGDVTGIFIGITIATIISSVMSFFIFNKSWKIWRKYARENK
jgi:Na+-driven multidrug efflux pump